MKNNYLPFIEDASLIEAVAEVVKDFPESSRSDITRNQLDPFGALFECILAGYDLNSWLKSEAARQTQKTIQNRIGGFHQTLLASLPGCEDVPVGTGLDIINVEQQWCAEVKNKFNTTKGNHLPRLYDDIAYWVDTYTKKYEVPFTGYYVQVIPRTPENFDEFFVPSDRGVRRPQRTDIKKITAAYLYEKITGVPDALKMVYLVIPRVLQENFDCKTKISDTQLKELYSQNICR